MRFRPCIDLHDGKVKQIVGSTLSDRGDAGLVTNFVATQSPAHFAQMYRRDGLEGGHVILLGPGNEAAATEALQAYPGGLQVGGGVTPTNARGWLDAGAAKVIVTSYIFRDGRICRDRLAEMLETVGRERLVLDLSCRRRGKGFFIVTDRWQQFTGVEVAPASLADLAASCSEFLVHAVDVEGKQQGIDEDLLRLLAASCPIPVTYAGGIRNAEDLARIDHLGAGRIDATAGSSLDIFGGHGLRYADAVAFDAARRGVLS